MYIGCIRKFIDSIYIFCEFFFSLSLSSLAFLVFHFSFPYIVNTKVHFPTITKNTLSSFINKLSSSFKKWSGRSSLFFTTHKKSDSNGSFPFVEFLSHNGLLPWVVIALLLYYIGFRPFFFFFFEVFCLCLLAVKVLLCKKKKINNNNQ